MSTTVARNTQVTKYLLHFIKAYRTEIGKERIFI